MDMQNVSEVYPSVWVHVDDLAGQARRVTIERAAVEQIRQQEGSEEPRIVVSFVRAKKKLILNKTQATTLARLTDLPEFEKWAGTVILLSPGVARNKMPTIVVTLPEAGDL